MIALFQSMAQLVVRRLSDEVVRRLKERAVKNGRSAEEEHRVILLEQLLGDSHRRKKSLKQLLIDVPAVGDDADFARSPSKPRKVDL